MPTKVRHPDGTVHFSQLKRMALSPAHYKEACARASSTTGSMRRGTALHVMLLGRRNGQRVTMWDGARRGKEWLAFKAEHEGVEILTSAECQVGDAMAQAVLDDPVAGELVAAGRAEVPVAWSDVGVECSTEGIDLVGDDWIGEIKSSKCGEPARFQRQALELHYHAQLAFYEVGCVETLGMEVKRRIIIAVESTPPHPVTVLELTDGVVALARRSVRLWLERHRVCEADDFWPGYAQSVVPFVLPPWLEEEFGSGGGEADDLDGTEAA